MFKYLQFDKSGRKRVTNLRSLNPGMLMDITVYRLDKGERMPLYFKNMEMAVLLTQGAITYKWEGRTEQAQRESVFTAAPYCLHVCLNTEVEIKAEAPSEIIVQAAENNLAFASHFYTPADNKIEVMGETQWEGTAKREVLTVFDYNNAPYSNLVIKKMIGFPGKWSSYPPHHHPQPEIYYYKTNPKGGHAFAEVGDDVMKLSENDTILITSGKTHPHVTYPGYALWYLWVIRHIDGNPYIHPTFLPEHLWVTEPNAKFWPFSEKKEA